MQIISSEANIRIPLYRSSSTVVVGRKMEEPEARHKRAGRPLFLLGEAEREAPGVAQFVLTLSLSPRASPVVTVFPQRPHACLLLCSPYQLLSLYVKQTE